MSGWVVPSFAYVLLIGGLGITTKLALRHVTWQEIIVWAALVYALIAVGLLILGQGRIHLGPGAAAAFGSGVLASTGLLVFFIAMGSGEASRVVPVTSAYPAVTLVLSALILAEKVTVLRAAGAIIVMVGVMLISLGR